MSFNLVPAQLRILSLFILALSAISVSSCRIASHRLPPRPAPTPAPAAQAPRVVTDEQHRQAQALNGFTFDFFAASAPAEKAQENFFSSPYSVATALALTYPGARGETAAQMTRAFHLPTGEDTARALAGLQAATNAAVADGNRIEAADALWGQARYPFSPDYLKTVQSLFAAEIRNANFETKRGRTQAAGEINGWVSEKTQGKIKDVVEAGTLKEDTRLVLVNTIYFKGQWPEPFQSSENTQLPFHRLDGKSPEATFMHKQEDFLYVEDESTQVLELPYRGNELSMVVVLPKRNDGIKTLRLDASWFLKMSERFSSREVILSLPKFKISAKCELKDPLRAVGIVDALGEGIADFSGMTRSPAARLFISSALQQAWVEVDEKGTEAAAATVMVCPPCSASIIPPPPPIIFTADHPFLFLIRDRRTGCILFIGRVMLPTE